MNDNIPEVGSASKLSAGTIGAGSGIAALLVFMLQNTTDTRVSFLVFDFTWPLWLVILVSAVFGAVIWLGLGVMRRHRRRAARRA